MRRVNVVGMSGSGKTTFARSLSEKLRVPHIELDSLYHEPNWTQAQPEVYRRRVQAAIAAEEWVVDGNYALSRDLVWERADTIVWLDMPFWTCLRRVARRSVVRGITREELWNGNRERLWVHLFTRDSMMWWVITQHARKRRKLEEALASGAWEGKLVVRLRSPQEVRKWMAEGTQDCEVRPSEC